MRCDTLCNKVHITVGSPKISRIAVWPLQALRDCPRTSLRDYQHTDIPDHHLHYEGITCITRASPALRGHHLHYAGSPRITRIAVRPLQALRDCP
ncbi:hypothetical protein BDZ89DRAFT_960232 [Hymenopellis radicata]|nr:hypothetical protein BDZ89DRAFT_960232 [Hymenopellis radicata]